MDRQIDRLFPYTLAPASLVKLVRTKPRGYFISCIQIPQITPPPFLKPPTESDKWTKIGHFDIEIGKDRLNAKLFRWIDRNIGR